jgi:hypothetical protein
MVGSWLGPVLMEVAMFSSSSTCSAAGPVVCGSSSSSSWRDGPWVAPSVDAKPS